MKVIGILGGVASGKSLVAGELVRLGAGRLDADRAAHEVLRMPQIEAAARRRWGGGVFGPDGRIDRGRLAEIVFAAGPQGPPEREYLEQLTHPEVGRLLADEAARLRAAGCQAAALDAPLLLEAGWDRLCNTLVFVDAPRGLRLARARERGWSEADFARRESAQESLEAKRRRADLVVDNSGPLDATRLQVERLWHGLVG
jgi:dephospho-CoA kinase